MAAGVTIKIKRKAGAFSNGQLAAGELGLDTTNGVVYFSADGSTVVDLPSLAAAQTLSAKKLSLTAAHGADDTYEGLQITGLNNTGGVTQWDAVYLNGSSQWALADANGSSTYPARGLAVATVSTGNATTVLIRGTVRNDAWSWTPGGTIYLSTTPGGLTQTAPSSASDKIQAVGFALTADIAFFDFNSLYLTKS